MTDPGDPRADPPKGSYLWEVALVRGPGLDYDHARAHLRHEGANPDGGGPALCGYDPGAGPGVIDFVWVLKAPDDGVCAGCVGRMLSLGGVV